MKEQIKEMFQDTKNMIEMVKTISSFKKQNKFSFKEQLSDFAIWLNDLVESMEKENEYEE